MLFPQVCVRMKQYKDELLAACLMFTLSLHPDMVALDIKAYIPALQVRKGKQMGNFVIINILFFINSK